jgi:hypothetical protein
LLQKVFPAPDIPINAIRSGRVALKRCLKFPMNLLIVLTG